MSRRKPSTFSSSSSSSLSRKRTYKYFLTYHGRDKHMRVSGIAGEVIPGKEYEVSEKIGQAFAVCEDWALRKKVGYEEIE